MQFPRRIRLSIFLVGDAASGFGVKVKPHSTISIDEIERLDALCGVTLDLPGRTRTQANIMLRAIRALALGPTGNPAT